jgi:hypothetical protein
MPRPVSPRKIVREHNGKQRVRFRIYVPRRLTDGRGKVKDHKTEKEAESHAAKINASLQAQLQGYDKFNHQERSIIAFNLERLPNGLRDLPKAIDLFIERGLRGVRTIYELKQECLDEKKRRNLSAHYLRVLRDDIDRFADTFGKRDAQSITGKEIAAWLHNQALSEYSKRNVRISLGTLFNFAIAQRYLDANPVASVPKIKISLGARCILSVDEAERLMRSAEKLDPGMVPLIALVLFGGLRPEEARRCRPEYAKGDVIDLPAGKTKNNKRRLVELSDLPTLKAWLARGGDMPPNNIQRRMAAIRADAKVKWGHDILRHSFCSYGVPIWGLAQTSLKADHSEAILKAHYRELVPRTDAERFWNIRPL